jgi:hypothetical protein
MAMDNITLTSGMRQNLFSLQRTAKSMDVTQNRLSSGKKVNSALDDPIAFFAAQGHTQRSSDLAIRKDEMSRGHSDHQGSRQWYQRRPGPDRFGQIPGPECPGQPEHHGAGLPHRPVQRPDFPDRHRGGGLQLQRHQPARWYRPGTQSPLTRAATPP